MSSKRKIRSETPKEQRKKQQIDAKEVISLVTPEKDHTSTSNDKKLEMESVDNAQNNSNNNTNNTSTEADTSSKPKEDPQCGICLDTPTVQGKLDSCTHVFCFECIEHWSKTANTCPFCKARFKTLTKHDLQNPENNKKLKKVRVRHRDQRPECEDPEQWIVYEDDDDEDEWIDDDLAAWGMPWAGPQSLPGNFWSQFLAGSLPEEYDENEFDDFIVDDDAPFEDVIDLTDDVEMDADDFFDDEEEQEDISGFDISEIVRQAFHPFARPHVPLLTATTRSSSSSQRTTRRSTTSRIRTLRSQMRNARSTDANDNNTHNSNNNNNNNNNRTRDSISGRTRSHSTNNTRQRRSNSNSNNQRNNSNNRRRS